MAAASGQHIVQVAAPTAEQAAQVLALRDRAAAAGGVSPLSDPVVAAVRERVEGTHLIQLLDDAVVGYAHVDHPDAGPPTAELVVDDRADVSALLSSVESAAGPAVLVWTRGEHSPVNPLLEAQGFAVTRSLLQLRRPLGGSPLDEPAWPDGVTVRRFEVGADEEAWLEVNNAAFATHPEQGGWTLADIRAREQEPWFDPAGFFVAESDGRMVGFHWTKDHGDAVGEVYVIGVHPAMTGKRLGEPLLLQGLKHLYDAGSRTVLLYVEADNDRALALYERLGFARWDVDRTFSRAR